MTLLLSDGTAVRITIATCVGVSEVIEDVRDDVGDRRELGHTSEHHPTYGSVLTNPRANPQPVGGK